MIRSVRYFGDPVLRKVATPVTVFDDNLSELAQDMLETMYDYHGVGLAAPQIGVSKRLFVVMETRPEQDDDEEYDPDEDTSGLTLDERRERAGSLREYVMVNPVITKRAGEQRPREGCLSLPGLSVPELERAETVSVRYQDLAGVEHELEAHGFLAQAIQHELDHLDGVLYIDRLPEAERELFLETHRKELAQMQRDARALLKELRDEPAPARVV